MTSSLSSDDDGSCSRSMSIDSSAVSSDKDMKEQPLCISHRWSRWAFQSLVVGRRIDTSKGRPWPSHSGTKALVVVVMRRARAAAAADDWNVSRVIVLAD